MLCDLGMYTHSELHLICFLSILFAQMWNPLGIVGVITAFNFPCAVLGEVLFYINSIFILLYLCWSVHMKL